MDETRLDYRQITAGCVVMIAMLAAGVLLGRCSVPAQAETQQPLPEIEPIDFAGYDFHDTAGRALVELDAFLVSLTTTTTSSRWAASPEAGPAAPATPSGDRWDQLAHCETGGDWATNTGNGFGGGLQFAHQSGWSTWRAFGGEEFAEHPWDASREAQIVVAERVLASSGWRAWPGCSRKFGWL